MIALLGDWMLGTQYLWPMAEVSMSDIVNLPSWERPTVDHPYRAPIPDETFTGDPGFEGGGTFTAPPGFDGTPREYSYWDEGDGTDPSDGGTITTVSSDGTITTLHIVANRQTFYSIEIRDTDGDRVGVVTDWTRGQLKRVLDKASELTFTVPYDTYLAADLVRPNTVWLRDRWGFVIDTFQIQKRRPTGNGDASYYEIECVGAIAQLGDEIVIEYNGDTAGATVADHVDALLALQQRNNPLELGDIDPEIADIEIPLFAQDTNIHAALLSLQMALPRENRGKLYVDAMRRLQWRMEPGDTTEQVITRAANVRSIEAETDYSALVNRIYMYGEGQDRADRLSLIDAGEVNPYIEDAASVATWGICPFIKQDRRVRYPDTLLRIANRILEEFAAPPTSVTVELLDLAKADDAPIGWRDIEIGGKYRVVDTALGIDQSVDIVAIETDLARPVPIRVELANQTRDLSDMISALVDALEQPLDVDGDRYPTMGRNYTSRDPRDPRAGDVRWNDGTGGGDPRGQMHDGDDWQDMGGVEIPVIWYTATSKAGLPDASTVEETALGRVTSGSQKGMVCVVNPDKNGWDAINFFE